MLLLQAICPAIRRELFPNAFVDIYITVLEHDGSILAAAITAASLALIQARIDMRDSALVACSTLWWKQPETFLADPTRIEEQQTVAPRLMMAMMPNLGQMTQLHLTGPLEPTSITEAVSICSDGIQAIYEASIQPALQSISSNLLNKEE